MCSGLNRGFFPGQMGRETAALSFRDGAASSAEWAARLCRQIGLQSFLTV